MKDFAIERVRQAAARGRSTVYQDGVLREFVQMSVLRTLTDKGAFGHVAFMGGTALRFLYGSMRFSDAVDLSAFSGKFRRFSEDVDLTLEQGSHDFGVWMEAAKRDLALAGFRDASCSVNLKATVVKAQISLPGLLHEAGLSPMKSAKMVVKVEMDTNPPRGAGFQTRQIEAPERAFVVRCHDLPSLMAGKIAALMLRPYMKARDWYDLLFYTTKIEGGARPNLVMLQDCIRQHCDRTGAPAWPAEEWLSRVRARIQGRDFPASLENEIKGFLEHEAEAKLLTRDNLFEAVHRIEHALAGGADIAPARSVAVDPPNPLSL